MNNSEPKEPGTEYAGVSAFGAGVLLEFRPIPFFGFEMGALMLPRKYESSVSVPNAEKDTFETKIYEFPVLFRMHLGHFLSFGVGGYYAKYKDGFSKTVSTNGNKSNSTLTLASQNHTPDDFGLATSLALRFRVFPLMHLLIDGRYTVGMKNNSTAAGGDRKYNDMQLLGGLQFGF